jgi:DnaJ family protein C protein 8
MSDDLDRVLSTEELALVKDREIERVLNCCPWDYYSILEINPLKKDIQLQNQIKRTYRKKTLLIHPDKVSNPNAPHAFDRLKKAELVLSFDIPESESEIESQDDTSKLYINEKKRLLAIYNDAENRLLRSKKIIQGDTYSEENYKQILQIVTEILNEEIKQEEIERNFQQQQEAKKMAEHKKVQQERELKKKLANKWEDERDIRVNNWRSYTNKIEKPKSKSKKKSGNSKKNVLA